MTHVQQITLADNLNLIVSELQSDKWETLDNNATLKNLTSFIENQSNYLLLAYENNEVVGMLTAHRLDKIDSRRCELLLYEIEVKSKYRGKGLAKKLIESLKKLAKKQGAYEIWVLAEPSNRSAQQLYHSLSEKKPIAEFMYTIDL